MSRAHFIVILFTGAIAALSRAVTVRAQTVAESRHFPVRSGDVTQSAITMKLATPSDTDELDNVARAFEVRGDAGDVEVVTWAGDTIVIPSCEKGERFECWIKQVKAENTTATQILLYE